MIIAAVVFILILSILILVHEVGHFTAAKKLGIKVEEFGFGLPPRIAGVKRGETVYSINWLPLGGFVKLYGEEGEEDDKQHKSHIPYEQQKKAFYARPIRQKIIVLLAGVFMNFILAFAIISYLFTQGVMVPTNRVHIEKILPNTPASEVGLKNQDVLKKFVVPVKSSTGEVEKFQTYDINSGDQLISVTKNHLGEELLLVVERNKQIININIIPRKNYPSSEGPMGIVISNYEEKKYPIYQAPFLGIRESMVLSWELVKGIAITIWKMVSFQPVSKDVAGPVGIYQMTGQAVKSGESAVLELLGLLSLNLAIVNVLPFPALDGGRLLFVLIEGITGKKVKTNWERYIHQAGLVILLFLMLLVTINDVMRIVGK